MSDIVFESPADQAGWVQMPNVVLMDATLSMQARLLYALLLHYARQDRACFPGQGTLALNLGVSDRSVREYIAELEAAKLIERRQRGQGKTCLYVILALGLRPKRLADDSARKHTSGGSTLPGKPGSTLPTEVEAVKKTQPSQKERAGAKAMRIGGKPVNADAWARTVKALDAFNAAAGKSLAATTGTGRPSQSAIRIYQRLREWPDVTAEKIAEVIGRTLASGWWGNDSPSVGVVFGPNVFEENLTRSAGGPSQSADRSATVGRTTGRVSRYDHVIESAT